MILETRELAEKDFETEINLKDGEIAKCSGEEIKVPQRYAKYIDKVLISEQALKKRIYCLAKEIAQAYKANDTLVCLVVLNGAVMLFPELALALYKNNGPQVELETFGISSYIGTKTSGQLTITKDIVQNLKGKKVLIIEDILDTGLTMVKILEYLTKVKDVKDVKICSLVDKPERRKVKIKADFKGFTIPNEYVIGYGFDYNQKFRNLPFVAVLKKEYY
ncbi:hypoxanthine phosphoribosyltransferase [bacterium]|nr:hypoxanthine phosphoribosyltransferase [bacterium]MBT5988454.1 hypoxanthine phosphoribosyltransferase [bacterium]